MLASAALLVAGCPTATNLTSARTLDKGALEVTLAPTFLNGVAVRTEEGDVAAGFVGVPSAEGQMRYGITDNLEIGAKLWLGGFAGHFKVGLLRSETAEEGFNLSFDPGVSYTGLGSGDARVDMLYVYLPVLAGYRFNGHELTVGPRLVPVLLGASAGSSSGSGYTVLGGGSVAVSFRLGDAFRLTPELSLLAPLGQDASEGAGGLAQFSLGFSFGTN